MSLDLKKVIIAAIVTAAITGGISILFKKYVDKPVSPQPDITSNTTINNYGDTVTYKQEESAENKGSSNQKSPNPITNPDMPDDIGKPQSLPKIILNEEISENNLPKDQFSKEYVVDIIWAASETPNNFELIVEYRGTIKKIELNREKELKFHILRSFLSKEERKFTIGCSAAGGSACDNTPKKVRITYQSKIEITCGCLNL